MWGRIVAGIAVTVLVGCGGGGGGGTPASSGIAEVYYPLATGARWAYDVSSTDVSLAWVDEVEITGQQQFAGQTAWVFSENNPEGDGVTVDSFYVKDTRAFTFLGVDAASADWFTALAPYDLMRFDGTFSSYPLFDRVGIDIGEDLDMDGSSEHADARMTGVVEGFETLLTKAGSFGNTARVRYDVTGTMLLSTGPSVPFTMTIREWRAPEVGTLRQTSSLSIGGLTSSSSVDLRGLLVNGIGGGVLGPSVLLPDLAAANSDETVPGRPAVASDGQRHLLVSNRETVSGRQWIAQFVAANGRAEGAIVDLSGSVPDLWGWPAVAWNGTDYLVATMTGTNGLRAQRVSSAGVVLDASPGSLIAADGRRPAMAAGAGKWLLVYLRAAAPGQLLGRFVSSDGTVDPEFVIAASGVWDTAAPAVAFDGSNFLVAWEVGSGGTPEGMDLYARRVTPAGALPDPAPLAVSTAAEAQWMPQVACETGSCLVAWVDRRNYPSEPYNVSPGPGDMYGTFISGDGTVLHPAGLSLAAGITANAGYPGLAWAGEAYLLAWSSGAFIGNPGGPTGIYAVRIDAAGAVTPVAPGIEVSGPPPEATTRLLYPVLAATPTGVLAAWLNNVELSGARKSVVGALVMPYLVR